jgi:hypothetical protein
MKKTLNKIIFSLLLATILLSSCKKEEETGTTDISGIWKCSDNASSNNVFDAQSYPVKISKINDTLYTVSNFANLGENNTVKICIISDNIKVKQCKIDQYFVKGTGIYKSTENKISINYYLDNELIVSKWNK